jgi:hypothetical protein
MTTIKSQEQAEKIAKELWGDTAYARLHGQVYFVGEVNGIFRLTYGAGSSWDDAFKQAKLKIN